MRKKKNAFTLIELLAVIVILAVILVISIPRILDVIETSKKDSFKSTAQLIADSAEKKYVTNKLNNIDEEITCDNIAQLSKEDYSKCTIRFNSEGKATINLIGKGKFDGLVICNGTKENAELKEGDSCATDAKYFAYEEKLNVTVKDISKCGSYFNKFIGSYVAAKATCTYDPEGIANRIRSNKIPSADYEEAGLIVETGKEVIITGYETGTPKVTVKDEGKCKNYLINLWNDDSEEGQSDATTLCSGNALDDGYTLEEELEWIPSSDYEEAGLEVTYTNGGGVDVVIPEKIDGKIVLSIESKAFNSKGITSVEIPNTVIWIGESAFLDNKLTSIEIGNAVTGIGDYAFSNNRLTNITIPNSVTSIGGSAFFKDNLSNPNLTKIINKTGKSFDWGYIVNSSSGYNFITGTIVNSDGNIEVVSE